ncbi:hypothetical protein [Pandoraea terrigena]|uniref:hypothetical protein n=1 Tax=Pandoraea terrigena TaxID=2508292 RepID=UPI001FEA2442|nr:hypothetical protein [Pandoraea terrigena]
MSNAVRGVLLALTDTTGNAIAPDVLKGVASGVTASAFVVLAVAELAASGEATCAKASGDVTTKAVRRAA